MTYLTGHWSFDPFGILALVVAAWHETGLRRLARRSRPDRTRQRRLRSLWFYSGLGVLLLAVESPIDYWADDYLFAHMIQHLLLMFAAPSLIVAGAPWQPLLNGLPGRSGRSVTRGLLAGGWHGWVRPLRGLGRLLLRPWVSVALFNAAMLLWHLPGPFGLAEENQAAHIWLMHGTMFGTGVLFWLQIIPSPPFRRRMPLLSQAGALLGTNVVMIGIAMTLSIFVQGSVYPVYDHIPCITLPPFADQQIGAVSGCPCRISSVCLVSASWMPNTRPAARPVRLARAGPRVLSPVSTAMYAMPAMIAATNQCANEPNDRPMGLVDRDSDSRDTPAHRIRSEERRVGKECRSRWSPYQQKKKTRGSTRRTCRRRGRRRGWSDPSLPCVGRRGRLSCRRPSSPRAGLS